MSDGPKNRVAVIAATVLMLVTLAIGIKVMMAQKGGEMFRDMVKGAKLQGPELILPKPEGTLRIIIIGGELAGSIGFPAEQSVRERVHSILTKNLLKANSTIKNIEVAAGYTGFRSPLDLASNAIITNAIASAPDLLVLFVENTGRLIEPPKLQNKSYTVATEDWARARETLARSLANALAGEPAIDLSLTKAGGPPGRLEALQEECKQKNIKLAIGVVPNPLESDSELRALALESLETEKKAPPPRHITFDESTQFAAEVRKKNMTAFDFTLGFREGADGKRMILLDYESGRWNAVAANVVAAQITTHVVSSGLAK
ncbi:MAG: hypothetical protein ACKVS6_16920 [Planctomycetota bacterium]